MCPGLFFSDSLLYTLFRRLLYRIDDNLRQNSKTLHKTNITRLHIYVECKIYLLGEVSAVSIKNNVTIIVFRAITHLNTFIVYIIPTRSNPKHYDSDKFVYLINSHRILFHLNFVICLNLT